MRKPGLAGTAIDECAGSRLHGEVGADTRSYHLSHSRLRVPDGTGVVGRPRHVVFYRLVGEDVLVVGRILHDAMEPGRHLAEDAPPG